MFSVNLSYTQGKSNFKRCKPGKIMMPNGLCVVLHVLLKLKFIIFFL